MWASSWRSVAQVGYVEFCVLTPKVDLKWDGSSLTVNQNPRCRLAQARSVLGQDGETLLDNPDLLDRNDLTGQLWIHRHPSLLGLFGSGPSRIP